MSRNNPPKYDMPAFTPFVPAVSPFRNPLFDIFAAAGENYAKACQAWQQEIVRFTVSRFQNDSKFTQRLSACQNWADAAQVQQEWAATMAQDFMEEGNRLAQLATTLSSELTHPPEQSATQPAPQATSRKTDAA
jgi:hypothetical protein